MQIFPNFFVLFIDSLMGHIALFLYLLAVTDEQDIWKRIKKFPPLCLSPLIASLLSSRLLAIAPNLYVHRYFVSSLAILLMCSVWMTWAWNMGLWRAFSSICMAGILQVATSALAQVIYLILPPYTNLIIVFIPYFLVTFGIVALLKKLRFGIYFGMLVKEETNIARTSALTFALELTMDSFLILQTGVQDEYLAVYYLLVIVLVALIISLVTYLARQFEASRLLQAQQDIIAQQQLYEQNLEEIRQEVRSFRHDYKNLLAGLSQQAGDRAFEELSRTLAELDAGFDQSLGEKIQASTQIGNLQIPSVRSLLLNKLTSMRKKDISCHLEVLYPVATVNMDIWDFVRCLGILLDNAIEAAAKTDHPWVEILLLAQKNNLSLRISNSWKETANPTDIWKEGWSTKGSGRGLGLPSYQRILKGYPNATPSTSWTDGVFVQELTIGEKL